MNLENEAFCEELHEKEEMVADLILFENQDRSIVNLICQTLVQMLFVAYKF
jgi:hypothetical protein